MASDCKEGLGTESGLRAVPFSKSSYRPLGGFEVQFFPNADGFYENICLVCGNDAGEQATATLSILQESE